MPRYAVLLRGVNVGKGNRIAMADFRALLEALGHSEVVTLLNSGNAVFTSGSRSSAPLAAAIAQALTRRLALKVPVVVKSAREMEAIVEGNTLARNCSDPSRLLVAFAQEDSVLRGLAALADLARAPELFLLGPHAAYLHCATGILESAAAKALLGKIGVAVTTRNWATVLKIEALMERSAA